MSLPSQVCEGLVCVELGEVVSSLSKHTGCTGCTGSTSPSRLAVSCDVANVHRVLDTIVSHVEFTEDGGKEAAVEAEFAPLDMVRACVVKGVRTYGHTVLASIPATAD